MPNIVKNTTFPGLFSLLSPHSCRGCGRIGNPLCDCCKNNIINRHQNLCPICHQSNVNGKCKKHPELPPIFIAGSRNDLLGDLIHDFKFNSVRALAHPLAEIMHAALPINDHPTVIVPLPTISRHVRERGFDHTHLIAKHLSHLQSHSTVKNLLIRTKNTIQVGSSRETRLSQASTAYKLMSHTHINPNTHYILFDDVWTTGATMQAAYQILQNAGAHNISIAILALSTHSLGSTTTR